MWLLAVASVVSLFYLTEKFELLRDHDGSFAWLSYVLRSLWASTDLVLFHEADLMGP